jgi:hypothetical protein
MWKPELTGAILTIYSSDVLTFLTVSRPRLAARLARPLIRPWTLMVIHLDTSILLDLWTV